MNNIVFQNYNSKVFSILIHFRKKLKKMATESLDKQFRTVFNKTTKNQEKIAAIVISNIKC